MDYKDFYFWDAELLLLHNARQIFFLICINQYSSTYLYLKEPSRLLDTSNWQVGTQNTNRPEILTAII